MSRQILNSDIVDALWLINHSKEIPTCNNCRYQEGCCYVPKKGEMVRINCIAHGWDEESLARMMPERTANG